MSKNAKPIDADSIRTLDDLSKLRTPIQIQQLIDTFAYNTEDVARCPQDALIARKVHCLDGALLAATALQRQGIDPQLVFLDADDDDGHVLAIFPSKDGTKFGAIAQSNFVGLGYREPVYQDLRELVMSYFESYFNLEGKKTLRSYSTAMRVNVPKYNKLNWETNPKAVNIIDGDLHKKKDHFLLSKSEIRRLNPVSDRFFKGGTLGITIAGCHGADKQKQTTVEKGSGPKKKAATAAATKKPTSRAKKLVVSPKRRSNKAGDALQAKVRAKATNGKKVLAASAKRAQKKVSAKMKKKPVSGTKLKRK